MKGEEIPRKAFWQKFPAAEQTLSSRTVQDWRMKEYSWLPGLKLEVPRQGQN